MIHLITASIDVRRNMQAFINMFLLFWGHEETLSKPPCIYFQFHGVIFFASGILLLLPSAYFSLPPIFNYDRDLPTFSPPGSRGCTQACLALKEIVELYPFKL
jgi:hypothetical protein